MGAEVLKVQRFRILLVCLFSKLYKQNCGALDSVCGKQLMNLVKKMKL